MAETVYDRVNDFTAVKVTLASPNDIRARAYGEMNITQVEKLEGADLL